MGPVYTCSGNGGETKLSGGRFRGGLRPIVTHRQKLILINVRVFGLDRGRPPRNLFEETQG